MSTDARIRCYDVSYTLTSRGHQEVRMIVWQTPLDVPGALASYINGRLRVVGRQLPVAEGIDWYKDLEKRVLAQNWETPSWFADFPVDA